MEMFEMRYFSSVAETQNFGTSSKRLNVSSSALCKAVSRLEEELGVELLSKEGRNIRLTSNGKALALQAQKFLALEQETRELVAKENAHLIIRIAGPEILLSFYSVDLISQVKSTFPKASFRFINTDEASAIELVTNRLADICFVTDGVTKNKSLSYQFIKDVKFGTYVSPLHPLANKKEISIEQVIQNDFVTPSENVLGELKNTDTNDGWRDDKFLRKIIYVDAGLRMIEELLRESMAVGYLPEYYGEALKLKKLNITGCPYSCRQKVYLAAFDLPKKKWLRLHLDEIAAGL